MTTPDKTIAEQLEVAFRTHLEFILVSRGCTCGPKGCTECRLFAMTAVAGNMSSTILELRDMVVRLRVEVADLRLAAMPDDDPDVVRRKRKAGPSAADLRQTRPVPNA